MRTKSIYKKSLAIQLMSLGANLVGLEPNPRNPNLKTFVFEYNQELSDMLGMLTGIHRAKKFY